QLTAPMLDALLERGQLLCHYSGGQLRIPMAQLEMFLRDSLVRLYRFEARQGLDENPLRSAATQLPLSDLIEEEPSIAAAPEPALEPSDAHDPEPETTITIENDPVETSYSDTRAAPRYVPRRQITGIFHDVRFTIVQLSTTGLRIRHTEPLLPGDEAKLSFALLNPPRSFVM